MPAKGFSKFDIDLKYGQIREDKVREMFGDKTIEVLLYKFFPPICYLLCSPFRHYRFFPDARGARRFPSYYRFY